MLELRDPQSIALELFSTSDVNHIIGHVQPPSMEIAGDFIFLDAKSAKHETEGRDAPLAELGKTWSVFAISGSGDAWLVSLKNLSQIAFLDHDNGPDAKPENMGLDFGQWLQLADVIRQFESADDATLIEYAEQLLEQISAGLSQRYPYRLEA